MNNQDIARVIASYLDNEVLEKVYLSGAMPSLKNLVSDQYFWHERVETLVEKKVPFFPADWRETYQILKRELSKPEDLPREEQHFSWNIEDNVTASMILSSLGWQPTVLDMTLAAENNSIKILKFLLEDGRIDPSKQVPFNDEGYHTSDSDEEEKTIIEHLPPLVAAASEGHEEAVRLLLADSRVDPAADDAEDYYTPLTMACLAHRGDESGNYNRIVKMLLDDGRTDPSWEENACLVYASENGDNHEIVRLLLADPRTNPAADDNSAIIYASEQGRTEIVKLLLQDPRVDPSDRGNTAVTRARKYEHTDIVHLLLQDPRVSEDY